MRLIYNGIDLSVIETYAFDAESVYDDTQTDYLFTKISLVVRALINGQAEVVNGSANGPPISYTWDKATPSNPTVVAYRAAMPSTPPFGSTTNPQSGIAYASASTPLRKVFRTPNQPALTHQVIRHRLGTPRGKFYLFSGPGSELGTSDKPATPGASAIPVNIAGSRDDLTSVNISEGGGQVRTTGVGKTGPAAATDPVMIVESPMNATVCDCKNGPIPKVLGMTSALGDATTLMVDFQIETYINEGPINTVNPSGALLSHRFSQTHHVDEHGFTGIATEGTAIYRTDLVYGSAGADPPGGGILTRSPDTDRPFLFMPIPLGFVRSNIEVSGRKDVTGIDYSYLDIQVPVNFVAGPYAKASIISAIHRQSISSSSDIFGGAFGMVERAVSFKSSMNFATRETAIEKARATEASKEARRMRKVMTKILKKI